MGLPNAEVASNAGEAERAIHNAVGGTLDHQQLTYKDHLATPAHRNAVEIQFQICVSCVGSNAGSIPKKVAETSSKTSREVSREVCREVVREVSVKFVSRAK